MRAGIKSRAGDDGVLWTCPIVAELRRKSELKGGMLKAASHTAYVTEKEGCWATRDTF